MARPLRRLSERSRRTADGLLAVCLVRPGESEHVEHLQQVWSVQVSDENDENIVLDEELDDETLKGECELH